MKIATVVISLLCSLPSAVLSQTPVKVAPAELAIPFGVAEGQVVVVGDYLLFLDTEKPEASFAAQRSALRDVRADAESVNVESAGTLTDRSGARSHFVFRMKSPAAAEAVANWFRSGAAASPAPTSEGANKLPFTYQVTHDHFIGNCSGRLIVEESRLVFESITDAEHSRRWALSDIKEIKKKNPYSLKVTPFAGDSYEFKVLGQGMNSEVFKALGDRIAAARSSR